MPDTSNESLEAASPENNTNALNGELHAQTTSDRDRAGRVESILPSANTTSHPSFQSDQVASIAPSSITQSTARLQQIVADEEDELTRLGLNSFASSSPLVRKSRRSMASTRSRLGRSSAASIQGTSYNTNRITDHTAEYSIGNSSAMGTIQEEQNEREWVKAQTRRNSSDEIQPVEDETTAILMAGSRILRQGMHPSSPPLDSASIEMPDMSVLPQLEQDHWRIAEKDPDFEVDVMSERWRQRESLSSAPESHDVTSSIRPARRKQINQHLSNSKSKNISKDPTKKASRAMNTTARSPLIDSVLEPAPEENAREIETQQESIIQNISDVNSRKQRRNVQHQSWKVDLHGNVGKDMDAQEDVEELDAQGEELDVQEELGAQDEEMDAHDELDAQENETLDAREGAEKDLPKSGYRKRGRPKKSTVLPINEADIESSLEAAEAAVDEKDMPRQSRRSLHPNTDTTEKTQPTKKARSKKRKASWPHLQSEQEKEREDTADISQSTKKKRRSKSLQGRRASIGAQGSKQGIPVTVRRFTKMPFLSKDIDDELMHSRIPFADKHSVNVIDVLLQICNEQLEASVSVVGEKIAASEDGNERKVLRVKVRALESYREELESRLEEHAIVLDHLASLQKRVKAVQKEKLALRDEILAIKREREDVALRMDAVRLGHEKDRKMVLVCPCICNCIFPEMYLLSLANLVSKIKHQLSLSKTMHDVDLAVEAGYNAPELTPEEHKEASLNNLELMIRQVMESASSKSKSGGALRQIREFNAFLERTAAALEKR